MRRAGARQRLISLRETIWHSDRDPHLVNISEDFYAETSGSTRIRRSGRQRMKSADSLPGEDTETCRFSWKMRHVESW